MVEFDQEYGVTIKHLPGVDNTGADGLSRHEILDNVPSNMNKLICEVNALDRSTNEVYPVSIQAIQEAQESGDDLRNAIASDKKGTFLAVLILVESSLLHTVVRFGYLQVFSHGWYDGTTKFTTCRP